MHTFLANNRDELIARCMVSAGQRPSRAVSQQQLRKSLPLFLAQLQRTLLAQGEDGQDGELLTVSATAGSDAQALSQVGVTAAVHGKQLLELGFSLDQVVHHYGDLCQAATELALEQNAPFTIGQVRTLHGCLDTAIADAVSEFSVQRDASIARATSAQARERLESLMEELRDSLGTATLAIRALETGNLPLSGATGGVLKRSHAALKTLVDRALDEVWEDTAAAASREPFSLAVFLAQAASEAAPQARERGCALAVRDVAPSLAIAGNRDRLLAALASVLQNAVKFTHPETEVTLMAYTYAKRIFIEVHDHCDGLPPGSAEELFIPFAARHHDSKAGLGLGLAIARQGVEADRGTLTGKNLPGTGCVFTISLPRRELHERRHSTPNP